ncbi:hypothetical protein KR009_009233 [Drosophila setifemur]|nr:hypothetical protein KR009_009233 [Drosophila setifemur]
MAKKKAKGKGKGKGKKIVQEKPMPKIPELEPSAGPVFDRNLPQYSFDLIITRLQVTGKELTDPRKLVVKVSFGGNNLSLSASRTNVTAFKPNASLNFQAEPKDLAQKLEENGLAFEVIYDEEQMGLGKVNLPKRLTNQTGWNMKEFNYTSTCNLELLEKPTGQLEFLCKMFIRCSDYARDGETCQNLNKNINKKDIVFVIGKSSRAPNLCDPCRGVLEDENPKPKEKDYSIKPNCE